MTRERPFAQGRVPARTSKGADGIRGVFALARRGAHGVRPRRAATCRRRSACRIDGELVPSDHGRPRAAVRHRPRAAAVRDRQQGHGQEAARRSDRHLLPRLRPEGDGAPGRPLRSLGYTLRDQGRHLDLRRRHGDPAAKDELLETAQKEVQEIEEQYTEGLITDGERYNKVVDIWAQVSEQIADEMMSEIGSEELHQRRDRREAQERRRSTRSTSWPTRAPAVRRSRSASWPACAA